MMQPDRASEIHSFSGCAFDGRDLLRDNLSSSIALSQMLAGMRLTFGSLTLCTLQLGTAGRTVWGM
jgi:hypothetical protein